MREVLESLGSGGVAALRWLGQHKWIEVRTTANADRPFEIGTNAVYDLPTGLEREVAAVIALASASFEINGGRAFLFLQGLKVLTEGLATGIKVLRPTAEQCLAMEHVELSLSYADYRQPFPAMFIEIPHKYRQHVKTAHGEDCHLPQYVGTWHSDGATIIQGLRATLFDDPFYMAYSYVLQPEGESTIETAFHRCLARMMENERAYVAEHGGGNPEADIRANELCVRLALNMNLMMTNSKCLDAGFAYPKWEKKLRKLVDRRQRPEDQAMLDAQPHLMAFEQNTVWHTEQSEPAEPGDGTGTARRTHWRRGHWRMQHYGEQNSKVRPTFIRPCLINGKMFDGSPSDTTVVYQPRTYKQVVEQVRGKTLAV